MDDERYMREALREAMAAAEEDEVPIGAVVVCRGRIIAKGHNMTERLKDPTAHAEMIAITAAAEAMGGKYLTDCTLYVTVEPCPMCASLLKQARVNHIYCGLSNSDTTNYEIVKQILNKDKNNSRVLISNDLAVEKVSVLMKNFFAKKRNK